jgi:signal transduction histidine kinase
LSATISELSDRTMSLAAANHAKDHFLSTLSHELRTPLTPIMTWVQLLKSRDPDPKVKDKAIAAIERSVRIQLQLIDDLLDSSRIASDKMMLTNERVDLSAVVNSAIETLQALAVDRGIRIESEFTVTGFVRGDPLRLQQVFWNLLSNAVKFSNSGGKITVRIWGRDLLLFVSIQDEGIGLEPAAIQRIFKRFEQVDSSTTRSHGGLGLGLSIVRGIVELHRGVVTAESPGKGKGSIFTVSLPEEGQDKYSQ